MKLKAHVILRKSRSLIFRIRQGLKRDPDRFLRKVSGVIHIGANIGQERSLYDRRGLDVVWVEPNPTVFETLEKNIEIFPKQRAFQYLVSDQDDVSYEFHIANNEGASSSILDLKLYKDVWPDISYEKTISLKSITLRSLLEKEQVNLREFNALVLDTQGSELLVLKGAGSLVEHFTFIKVEVPDFEAYKACCQLDDMNHFLIPLGYKKISQRTFGQRMDGGCYYDIIYKRSRCKKSKVESV